MFSTGLGNFELRHYFWPFSRFALNPCWLVNRAVCAIAVLMKGIVPSRKASGGTPGASTDFVSPGRNMGHAKTNPWDTNHLGTAHGAGIGIHIIRLESIFWTQV